MNTCQQFGCQLDMCNNSLRLDLHDHLSCTLSRHCTWFVTDDVNVFVLGADCHYI